MSAAELTPRLFLALGAILAGCAALSRLGRRFGQPPVVCEMLAGVLLGPSLLGRVAPGLEASLFPPELMPHLAVLSRVGLALYMFCVGLEFRLELLQRSWRASAAVSLAGIAAPLALGGACGALMHGGAGFFPPEVARWQAALFGGAAVCVTAFPVLARIVMERGLAGTSLGTLALGAGAFDDVAAWSVLSLLLAVFSARPSAAIFAGCGAAVYAAGAWVLARPLARRLVERAGPAALGAQGLAATLIALTAACWLSDRLRVDAVFGAFALGAALPRGEFGRRVVERVEPLTSALLVPVFFAYAGLNTRLGLLDGRAAWLAAGAVLAVSCLAKAGACGLAARAAGFGWWDAAAVGALMNARGMMELILLDIAYQRGLITQTTFTIYVLMAVATTLMATPLFELARPGLTEEAARAPGRALGAGA